jgi:hypothetical protein
MSKLRQCVPYVNIFFGLTETSAGAATGRIVLLGNNSVVHCQVLLVYLFKDTRNRATFFTYLPVCPILPKQRLPP